MKFIAIAFSLTRFTQIIFYLSQASCFHRKVMMLRETFWTVFENKLYHTILRQFFQKLSGFMLIENSLKLPMQQHVSTMH